VTRSVSKYTHVFFPHIIMSKRALPFLGLLSYIILMVLPLLEPIRIPAQ